MSDIDEPPTKLCKVNKTDEPDPDSMQVPEDEALDEGQEEWLSEGILTDDDYNPASVPEGNESNAESQDGTMLSNYSTELSESAQQKIKNYKMEDTSLMQAIIEPRSLKMYEGQDIEETLNNLDGIVKNDLEDDLNTFTKKKEDRKSIDKIKTEPDDMKSDDDGNDTDSLLRVLGDNENRTKKKIMKSSKSSSKQNIMHSSCDDDDDEFIFQGAQVKTLKVAKNAVIKKYPVPTKAVPEEDITDFDEESYESSEEASNTMQQMFGIVSSVKKIREKNFASKSTTKQQTTLRWDESLRDSSSRISSEKDSDNNKPTLRQYVNNRRNATKSKDVAKKATSLSSANTSLLRASSQRTEAGASKTTRRASTASQDGDDTKDLSSFDALRLQMSKLKDENHDFNEEEEFLEDEDDNYELEEEEFAEESDFEEMDRNQFSSGVSRELPKPEEMDEEVPSDEDSNEDDSLYDEMPSSGSEDGDDWFTLDIRAERAGEYLPMLGSRAKAMLTEEKRRMTTRLTALRQSLSALTESARKQSDQIREATLTLVELDDMLKAN